MITINDLKNNTINLNNKQSHYEFNVSSVDDNGNNKNFAIELVTSEHIIVKAFDISSISIDINIPNILKEETIVLKNTANERLEIKVLPNSYYTMKKEYTFKIGKRIYKKDGSLKVKIVSMANDMELGWRCSYDGKPMSYSIFPRSNDVSCYVTITQAATVVSEFDSLIKFTQDESGNEIKLVLHNTPEGIKKKVD
jgi:hypothetical protein